MLGDLAGHREPAAAVMPIATYLTGQCIPCKRRFRWVMGELKMEGAACLGCEGPLIRCRASSRLVEHVDAEWLKREIDFGPGGCPCPCIDHVRCSVCCPYRE